MTEQSAIVLGLLYAAVVFWLIGSIVKEVPDVIKTIRSQKGK